MRSLRDARRWLPLLLLVACVACGKKAPPKVPAVPRPEPVSALHVIVREGGVSIVFTPPAKLTSGLPLPAEGIRYEIQRRQGEAPASLLPIQASGLAASPTGQAVWTDAEAAKGNIYRYRIRPMSGDQGGAWSEWVTASVGLLPGVPQGLSADPADSQVLLEWSKPASGDEPFGYLVERATGGVDFPLEPLTREPVKGTTWVDHRVVNGTTYRYRVRAVAGTEPPWQTGPPSAERTATPADLTPPSAPGSLRALASREWIDLTWEGSPESDTVGYRIYRREDEGNFALLTQVPVRDTLFRDTAIVAGRRYYYRVTAVDDAAVPNESPPSAEARVGLSQH